MTTLQECTNTLTDDANIKCVCTSGQTDCTRVMVAGDYDCVVSTLHSTDCNRQVDSSGQPKQYAIGDARQLECCGVARP